MFYADGSRPPYTPIVLTAEQRHTYKFKLLRIDTTTTDPITVCAALCALFIPDKFLDAAAKHTAEYVASDRATRERQKPITRGDLLHMFAIIYFMGYTRLPSREDYWRKPDDIHVRYPLCVGRGMSWRRFYYLWRHCSFSPNKSDDSSSTEEEGDTEEDENVSDEGNDMARKIEAVQ